MFQWLNKLRRPKQPIERHSGEIEVDERVLELVNLGNKMLMAEDYDGAMDAYESALRMDGHNAEAWQRRGRIFLQRGNIAAALASYVRSLELNTQAADAWCGLGEAILAFLKADKEPIFIREFRMEIACEAYDCFDRAMKLGGDLPHARQGREACKNMIKNSPFKIAHPRLFSFHSGGILESAKREYVAPFLKPNDYRRKTLTPPENH